MNFDELFTKWKSEYSFNAFIRDGIVDPAHYDRPHILFILRDMNCRHERDLCADLRRDGSGWRTWNNIVRWTKALLDGDGEYPWDMSSLPQCQVMNSKKGKKYPLSIKRRGDICDTNYNLFAFQRIHKIIAKRP